MFAPLKLHHKFEERRVGIEDQFGSGTKHQQPPATSPPEESE
jgi:hypothetical protein